MKQDVIIAQKIIKGVPQFHKDGKPNTMSFSRSEWTNTQKFFPGTFKLIEGGDEKINEDDDILSNAAPAAIEKINEEDDILSNAAPAAIEKINEEEDTEKLYSLLEKEKEGKNRKGVIAAIEEQIELIEED